MIKSLQLALFGDPVEHSLSPVIYKAFGRQFEIRIDYQLIRTPAENLRAELHRFRDSGGDGCNFTLPLKHEALSLAEILSPNAALANAANTMWWDSENRAHAENTDGPGLVRDLEDNLGLTIYQKTLVILGAGGAAAGVVGALLEREPEKIIIANRTPGRAEDLAKKHAKFGRVEGVSLDDLSGVGADMVIDATSLGHLGKKPDIPESFLKNAGICYSLNYANAAQPMRDWCGELGVPFQAGLGMLVEQAALAFEIWTGLAPQTESVYKDLDYATR